MSVYQSNYKNCSSICVESPKLKAQFLPGHGGKLVSLVCNQTGREFLAQNPSKEYITSIFDGDYVQGECSGFDDMFPTIDACYYERPPWTGVRLPDHGEVWSLPWDCRQDCDSLFMSLNGVRLPYRLEKRIRFETDDTLRIDYRAVNLSPFDMDFIWAAHPIINAEEGGELMFDGYTSKEVTCVFSSDENLGRYGDVLEWPYSQMRNGDSFTFNRTGPQDEHGINYKIYFNRRIQEGIFKYRYKNGGTSISILFPADKVPYLSIWVNEGSFHGFHSIAPEPCTGAFDRIDVAKLHGMNSIIAARGEYTWHLKFKVEVAIDDI